MKIGLYFFFTEDSLSLLFAAHVVRSKRSSAHPGILPRTARVARLRCKRVSSSANKKESHSGSFLLADYRGENFFLSSADLRTDGANKVSKSG